MRSHTLRACMHAKIHYVLENTFKVDNAQYTQDQHRGGVEDHIRFPEGPLHNRAQHFQQDNRQDSLQVGSKPSKTLKKKKSFPISSPVEERRPEEEMAELLQVFKIYSSYRMEYGEQ